MLDRQPSAGSAGDRPGGGFHLLVVPRPPRMAADVVPVGERLYFRFCGPERERLRRPAHIPVSRWAEGNRVLTMSSKPGAWKNETTPHLAGIMDAALFPSVSDVILCKSVQSGGSEAIHNVIGYCIDRAPGPVMYLYPDQATAKENARDRVLPMITSSPRLRGYLTGAQDDMGQERINLLHMPIYFAWAGSASRMANKPCRYVVQDETDKYPETAARTEADPSSLVEKRLTTYRRSGKAKNFKLSTPTVENGVIWRALTEEAQVIFDYWVRCPVCGGWQLMAFDDIRVPEGVRDPERIAAENLAWYQCQKCAAKWDDFQRDKAVAAGGWRSRGERAASLAAYLETFRPKKIGFHLPAWISSFVTLSECAAAFFRGLGNRNKLKDFCNNYKAEPWLAYEQARSEDQILLLCDERPSGAVPGGGQVACLVAGVDTQDAGFWYEVRAFGFGQARESWQVRAGFVDSLDALAEVLWGSAYADAEGHAYFVRLAVQDAMGHRTDEVYDFARRHRGRVYACQGVQRLAQPYAFSPIDRYPGTQKVIPGGLKLLRADVNYFKNILSGKLEIAPGDPGAWHLCAETSAAWARQMTVEYIDEDTGLWACPANKANHAWDCSVYALLAAEVLGVRYWPRPGEAQRPKAVAAAKKTASGGVPLW